MTNGFFDATKWTRFIRNTRVRADAANAVFDAIVVAFDLIPPLSTLTSAAASLAAVAGAVSQWVVAGGTADAITGVFPTTVLSLTDGLVLGFRATAANATATPTFKADGTTAHTITKQGGAALVAGDIAGNLAECILRYNLANTRWELLNPAAQTSISDSVFRVVDNGDATKKIAFEASGIATGTTRTLTMPDQDVNLKVPTRQVLTSGSGATYTTPAGVRQLRIRMLGAGGGGATGNTGTGGSAGGFSSFDNAGTNYKANGGGGGNGNGNGGNGGSGGTGGTSPTTIRYRGNDGAEGNQSTAGTNAGGLGSGTFLGGANRSTVTANTGAGGFGQSAINNGGGGGGAGEYVEILINSPSATYTYTIGAGGAAGGGSAGAGASGIIIVEEFS